MLYCIQILNEDPRDYPDRDETDIILHGPRHGELAIRRALMDEYECGGRGRTGIEASWNVLEYLERGE